MNPTVIYQWPRSSRYLINQLLPEAAYLPAEPDGDTCESVLERLEGICECLWFHLDCTLTSNFPDGRMELLAWLTSRNVHVINGHITDISKKHIQQFNRDHGFHDVSATQTGDPDEMLIVKSNYNYFGVVERKLSLLAQARLGLSDAVPEGFEYRVEKRSSVDSTCWTNPAFVCERFIHNPYGIWYRAYLRRPKVVVCQFQNPAPIKKVGPSIRLQTTSFRTDGDPGASGAVASLVLRFIDAFRLDFGCLDVVTDLKGFAAVIDVNPTPWATVQPGMVSYLTA